MNNFEYIIENQMSEDGEILRTSKILERGVTKAELYSYIRKNDLEKVGQGLYIKSDALVDEMYLLQLRFPKVIFSMETALYLHGLSEMEPMPFSVTVPAKYNTKELINSGNNISYVKNEWYELGVCEAVSQEGNTLKVYDKERTICDIIRNQANMDVSTFNYAIIEYMRSRDKDLSRLLRYAMVLKVERKLRTVMGVLF